MTREELDELVFSVSYAESGEEIKVIADKIWQAFVVANQRLTHHDFQNGLEVEDV